MFITIQVSICVSLYYSIHLFFCSAQFFCSFYCCRVRSSNYNNDDNLYLSTRKVRTKHWNHPKLFFLDSAAISTAMHTITRIKPDTANRAKEHSEQNIWKETIYRNIILFNCVLQYYIIIHLKKILSAVRLICAERTNFLAFFSSLFMGYFHYVCLAKRVFFFMDWTV